MIDLSRITNARAHEILHRRLNLHETLESIAIDYNITRERVRQICNKEISRLPDGSYYEAVQKMDRRHVDAAAKRRSAAWRSATKKRLMAAFEVGFDRSQILSIVGLEDDPGMDDLSLCQWLYDEFFIHDCYKYFWCNRCQGFKLRSEFSPSVVLAKSGNVRGGNRYCTKCNTARHRKFLDSHPEARKAGIKWQRANPNRCKIFILRYYYKQTGRPEIMPPVPPLGTPDSEIKIPDHSGPGDWWHTKSPEEKARIVKLRLKNWRNWFNNMTPEERAALGRKISAGQKGKKKPRHASRI